MGVAERRGTCVGSYTSKGGEEGVTEGGLELCLMILSFYKGKKRKRCGWTGKAN